MPVPLAFQSQVLKDHTVVLVQSDEVEDPFR